MRAGPMAWCRDLMAGAWDDGPTIGNRPIAVAGLGACGAVEELQAIAAEMAARPPAWPSTRRSWPICERRKTRRIPGDNSDEARARLADRGGRPLASRDRLGRRGRGAAGVPAGSGRPDPGRARSSRRRRRGARRLDPRAAPSALASGEVGGAGGERRAPARVPRRGGGRARRGMVEMAPRRPRGPIRPVLGSARRDPPVEPGRGSAEGRRHRELRRPVRRGRGSKVRPEGRGARRRRVSPSLAAEAGGRGDGAVGGHDHRRGDPVPERRARRGRAPRLGGGPHR